MHDLIEGSPAPTRNYERFWSNAIRWLVPDLTTLSVTADPPSVEPGKPVGVVVVVVARQSDYQPAPGAKASVDLIDADDGHVVGQHSAVVDADGMVRFEFPPPPGCSIWPGSAASPRSLGKASVSCRR